MSYFYEQVTPPPSLRVVVIDDDPEARQLARFTIEADHLWQYLPSMQIWREFWSGREAVGLLADLPAETPPPDLILCDVEMPGLDGWQTVCELRLLEHLKDVPIVMVTTRTGDANFEELARQHGVAGWATKPANTPKAIKAIGDVLRRRLPRPNVLIVASSTKRAAGTSLRGFLEPRGYNGRVRSMQTSSQALRYLAPANQGIGCIIVDMATLMQEQTEGSPYVQQLLDYAKGAEIPLFCFGDGEEGQNCEAHAQWADAIPAPYYEQRVWGPLKAHVDRVMGKG